MKPFINFRRMEDDEIVSSNAMQLPPWHHYKSNVLYYFLILLFHFWNFASTIVLIVIQALKIYYFPAPKAAKEFSMVAPFFWFVVNVIKLQCAKYGNRSEHLLLTIIATVLSVGSILIGVYFLVWQIYVWRWEPPFIYISIGFDCVLIVFSIILIILFAVKN
ncbi:hypothetical protein TRFO_31049 [Tritrichomonas foetus]|uniref:Transmembrane protein n=1 Tax=Tritrichomonas foetus TaxID=1144522 RepID=A0A1J4JXG6_9EUKA|nr:hypothetical protein TRFO_31049 [Tritrichomonas foetus]|eukprot:OHT01973.1 hypothetical protein TRFO_31049 [Tritrichomonas foetus]